VLCSMAPEGAEQECWTLLCTYHAICELISAVAALCEQDPLRFSFVNALDALSPFGTGPMTSLPPSSASSPRSETRIAAAGLTLATPSEATVTRQRRLIVPNA
jgi:hypothetical protein